MAGVEPEDALNPFLDVAMQLAGHGIKVVPIHTVGEEAQCSCGNAGCEDEGKHPRHKGWQKEATAEGGRIHRWFASAWREGNLGALTGSGFMVLDLDGARAREWGERVTAEHGQLPRTWTARTGRGQHRWFRVPPGVLVRSRTGRAALAPQVEVKGEGGFVVVPPSLHVSGKRYEWKVGPTDMPQGPATAPDWLIDLCRQDAPPPGPAQGAQGPQTAPRPTADVVVIQGQRNSYLATQAGKLRDMGFDGPDLEAAVLALNEHHCRPPLSEEEIRRTILKSAEGWAGGAGAQDAAFQARRQAKRDVARPDHLRVVLVDPRVWYLRFPDLGELQLSTEQLESWTQTRRAFVNRFLAFPAWQPRNRHEWEVLQSELMDQVEEVEAPAEFTLEGRIITFLRGFCDHGQEHWQALDSGRVWIDQARKAYIFRTSDLIAAIDRDPSFRFEKGCNARQVNEIIREHLAGKVQAIRKGPGRDAPQVKAMVIPTKTLDEPMEESPETPGQETDDE